MAFGSFVGTVLFVSVFILSAYQELNMSLPGLYIALKGVGGVLFVFGSLLGAYLLNMALVGALLFFIPMKNSTPRKHKKKVSKTKTV